MLKILAIVAVFAIGMSGQPNNTANQEATPSHNRQPPAIALDSHEGQQHPQQTPANSDNQPFDWHTAVKRPEWWAVGIALATLSLIFWQAWETRKAANAARDGVEIIIRKERARIAAKFVWEDFVRPNDWESQQYPELASGFVISIENQGLTRAYDVSVFAAVMVMPTRDYPPLGDAIQLTQFSSRVIKAESNPIEVEVHFGSRYPKLKDVEPIRNETAFMHLFGYVAYTDAFDRRQHHPFRWVWKNVEFDVETEVGNFQTIDQSTWEEVVLGSDQTYRQGED